MARARVWIVAGPEFRRVAVALREFDATATRDFRKAINRAARPIIGDVKQAALALPAHGPKHTGLRGRLAKGVRLRTRLGKNASLRIVATVNNPEDAALPRGMDSGLRGWRHPVYGNEDNWVHQRGNSWFRETISDDRDWVRDRLREVLNDAAHRIAAAGGSVRPGL